ncbi:hypothetical protein M9Y10_024563 [Tritrichomonas musculus]|uniref:mitogen-activated protein kinase kinase n=1 Tax=Tritrichomonas musculus TaxID=1915356 RepID=A0ABR2HCF2_9EUKA
MIFVCGKNDKNQLRKDSNNKGTYGKIPVISQPCQFEVDLSSLLSISFYCYQTAWVTKDRRAYAIGKNLISGSMTHKIFKTKREITFTNKKGQQCQFISAVCGFSYTLYHVTSTNDLNHTKLVFSHELYKEPIFLNINGREPVGIFGGHLSAAVIDTEGAIIVITESVFESPNKPIESNFLPNSEKAVSVACLKDSIFALSSTGRVFKSPIEGQINFQAVDELKGIEIADISGKWDHCLAISKEGRVYACGVNTFGQLGIGENEDKTEEFEIIASLNKYKITSVFAGVQFSMFLTSEGKVLACGVNDYGQLAISGGPSRESIYLPVETEIKDATFCIAGAQLSAFFVNSPPPPNTPNMKVSTSPSKPRKHSKGSDKSKEELLAINASLMEEIASLKKKIASLEQPHESNPSPGNCVELLDSETIHSLRVIREISSGGSGKVLEVGKEETFALKVMHTGENNFKNQRQFLGEHEKLNMLRHPNVVRTYGIYLSDETTPPSILLELCPDDLNKAIKSGKLSNGQIVKYVYQISEGMKFVHIRGFVHRDLKPSNILIAKDGTIKISDFGISKLMTAEEQSTTLGAGTQKFMSPEILNEEDYNEKADVYSFGVVLYFMLSGGQMPKITIIQMGIGKKAPIPSSFTSFAKQLINSCWETSPEKRPSFDEILQELEKNNYKLLELSDTDVKDIKLFVKEHKQRIPPY